MRAAVRRRNRSCSLFVAAVLFAAFSPVAAQQLSLGVSSTQTAAGFRYQIGRRVTYVCPATAPENETHVWGTDVYTFDSAVCFAAIHAGVLGAGQVGAVTFVIGPGAAAFTGSARNGVTSASWGAYDGSFTFDRSGEPGRIDGLTTLRLPESFTTSVTVVCPPLGTYPQPLWGADIYSDGSSICAAAAHAGLITLGAGGSVSVQPAGPQSSFTASSRNGVTSQSSSAWPTSFSVAPSAAPIVRAPMAAATTGVSRQVETQSAPIQGQPAPRTIDLQGFTAQGSAPVVVPRMIETSGFSAVGTAPQVVPRLISLTGWAGTGTTQN